MKVLRQFFGALALALWCLAGPAMAGQGVTVFAAASLKGALDEVAAAYDGEVRMSFGGSGAIARQVALGAPADVVITANVQWMDWLEGQGVLRPGSRVNLVSNRLVVVGPKGAPPLRADADALAKRLQGGARLAIGQVDAVPAGIYGHAWLQAADLWREAAPHLAQTENVRAALALVARGEAPLGIVYASDALAEPGVSVVYEVPRAAQGPILYAAAIVEGAGDHAPGFLAWVKSDTAQGIFRRYGFLPPDEGE